ncbi:hypothetical protein [Microbacterium sp.]|nr:hypothetical protein [Microbacterium sp.]
MAIPSLILTPRESRSRYGTVTPELSSGAELRARFCGWEANDAG